MFDYYTDNCHMHAYRRVGNFDGEDFHVVFTPKIKHNEDAQRNENVYRVELVNVENLYPGLMITSGKCPDKL